jgi:hypothetical protein
MASKITLMRQGSKNGEELNEEALAVFEAYLADGRITEVDAVKGLAGERITIYFATTEDCDSYIAELDALGDYRVDGVTVSNIQRVDNI